MFHTLDEDDYRCSILKQVTILNRAKSVFLTFLESEGEGDGEDASLFGIDLIAD